MDFSEKWVKKFGGGVGGDESIELTRSVRVASSNETDGSESMDADIDEEDRSIDIKTRLMLFAAIPLFYFSLTIALWLRGKWKRADALDKKE